MTSRFRSTCFSLVLFVATLVGPSFTSNLHAQDPKTLSKDEYAFEWRDYLEDPKQGFSDGLSLIRRAEAKNAPPQTIARLFYQVARIRSWESLHSDSNGERLSQPINRPTLTILNKVLNDPERFLSNDESAVWYANCTNLLLKVYSRKEDSRAELKQAIETAISAVESAEKLSDGKKRVINANIRLGCSDVAMDEQDWDAAIEWLQPTIDAARDYMFDSKSVATLAMTVRQQSMFIAEKNLWNQSADLVESMCQEFEDTNIDEDDRIRALCMLRGKTFVNFSQNLSHPRAKSGWKHYETISTRANNYEGPDKQ